MPTRPVRVAVWSTGGIGTIAIRAIQRRPDLELVGVWVHSPEKEGRDAGELADIGPIGLAATNDVDAILGAGVDCVVYAAQGPEQDAASVPDYVKLLSAGVNVSTTSSWALLNPATYEPTWRAQLEAAAAEGGASIYATGIEPGFAADQLPLLLTTMSNSITSIRASEIAMYDTYPVEFMMKEVMGFGKSLDDADALLGLPGSILSAWAPGINLIADAFGAELDGIREQFDAAATAAHARSRVRHHRGRHRRCDPHAGDRRGRRSRRDRDRAREPHGRRSRARVAHRVARRHVPHHHRG